MAVSMNSNFMRSDFMISDAALPIRMDELELEQLGQEATFSDILGGIGEPTVQEAAPTVPQEDTAATQIAAPDKADDMPIEAAELSKSELKALARAVVQGKIKLDEIPEEYVCDALMMAVAMMMQGVPEDEIPLGEYYSEEIKPVRMDITTAEAFLDKARQNADIDELIQFMSVTSGVEIPEDMKRELGVKISKVELEAELTYEAPKSVAEENSHTENQAEAIPVTANQSTETAIHEAMAAVESSTADVAADDTEIPIAENHAQAVEAVPVAEQNVVAQSVPAQDMQNSNQGGNQGSSRGSGMNMAQADTTVQTASVQQTKITEEFEQLRRVVTEFTVKKSESEQPVQQSYTVQAMGTENAAKSRVVSKSEELEILKGMSRPVAAEVEINVQQTTESTSQQNPDVSMQMNPEVNAQRTNEGGLQQNPEAVVQSNPEADVQKHPEAVVQNNHEADVQPDKEGSAQQTAEAGTEQKLGIGTQQKTESGTQTEAGGDMQQLPTEQLPQDIRSDAPVVFVRNDGTQLEVRPSEIARQITATVIEQTTTEQGDTEYSITLNPEDLGSITVKLTKLVDGTMTVSITAENAGTQRLIEQSGAAIQDSLKQNNIQLENWQTVNQSEQQASAQDYSNSHRNPQYSGEDNRSEEEDNDGESFAELISAM